MVKPTEFRFDPGRVLPVDERIEVAKTVIPLHLIKSKTCKRETDNDRYRLGRR